MSKKRWAAFCLLAALCLGLMIPSVLAEDVVYFTAVNNTLLELSAETMPVTHNSMIYVPCSVFNSRSLNTWAYYSREGQTVLVSDGERELYFDMSAGNSHDRDENAAMNIEHEIIAISYICNTTNNGAGKHSS